MADLCYAVLDEGRFNMVLTNKFGLPEPFVDAVREDEYVRGSADFTTTELISPVRIRALLKKHAPEIVEDASERVWALSGQARHAVLEKIARTNPGRYMVEHRFEAPVGNCTISGKIDLYDKENNILYDFKETSVWKFIMGDTLEWTQQGNINLLLMRLNSIFPSKLCNIALLKDWKARKARLSKRDDYPRCAVHVVNLPMWPIEQAQTFVLGRITEFQEKSEDPPLCTKRERWQRDTQFAVIQKGRKRAIRVLDDIQKANALLKMREGGAQPGQKFFIEERPTEPIRCLDFCPVQQFCDFGREAVQKWREATNE